MIDGSWKSSGCGIVTTGDDGEEGLAISVTGAVGGSECLCPAFTGTLSVVSVDRILF